MADRKLEIPEFTKSDLKDFLRFLNENTDLFDPVIVSGMIRSGDSLKLEEEQIEELVEIFRTGR